MGKQPFLLIVLESGQRKIINEAQVCSVENHVNGFACLKMSNGDELIVQSPNYEDWENDVHARKD